MARLSDLGRLKVLEIRPDRLAHYRDLLATLDVSPESKDDVIHTLAWFMQCWIDQSFQVDPVQLAGKARLSDSFQKAAHDVKVSDGQGAASVDLLNRGREESAITNDGFAP